MNIGDAIKLCRKAKNLTQSDLSNLTQLSISYISLLEKNKRDANLSVIEVLSKALEVPLALLIFIGAEENDLPELGNALMKKLKNLALKVINNAE